MEAQRQCSITNKKTSITLHGGLESVSVSIPFLSRFKQNLNYEYYATMRKSYHRVNANSKTVRTNYIKGWYHKNTQRLYPYGIIIIIIIIIVRS